MKNSQLSARDMVAQVEATLALENLYVSESFRKDLLLIAQNKKSSKEVLEALDKDYLWANAKYDESGRAVISSKDECIDAIVRAEMLEQMKEEYELRYLY